MQQRPLENCVAVVTGASSGIGEAAAHKLSADGASVVLVARRGERLKSLAGGIAGTGVRTHAIEADVTKGGAPQSIVNETIDTFGRLDILVNNAGVMLLGPIVDAPVEEWDRMLSLNVSALMHLTHAALPHLLEAAKGPRGVSDIVNISSVAGRIARNGSGAYNASKWAVNAFSESLRQEVTRRHVRVSLVEPGAVETELVSHNRPEVQEQLKQRFADMSKLLASEDIGDAISYIVTRPAHVAINELLIRPTEQEG